MGNSPTFVESQTLPDIPYGQISELIGLNGILVEKPEAIGPAWERVLSNHKTTVLEVTMDPNVPALPPYATFKQAKSQATAMLKGDPQRVWDCN